MCVCVRSKPISPTKSTCIYIYIYKAIISKTHVSPELSENKKNAHDPLGGHPFIATEVHKLFNFKCPASGWNRRSNQRERLDLLKRKKKAENLTCWWFQSFNPFEKYEHQIMQPQIRDVFILKKIVELKPPKT